MQRVHVDDKPFIVSVNNDLLEDCAFEPLLERSYCARGPAS